jgi:hypothetical protein
MLPLGSFAAYNDVDYMHNIQGSNCYSYAFNHHAMNGSRPRKSVPGFLSTYMTGKQYPETDWQNCRRDVVQRVLDDGKVVSDTYELGVKTVKEVKGTTVEECLRTKPSDGYRRVVMVIAPKGERKGVATDFHFYAQQSIPLSQLYNLELKKYSSSKKMTNNNNPYIKAGIHPFSTSLQIAREEEVGNKGCKSIKNTDANKVNRAITNIQLHRHIMPSHMLSYIPAPFWILDIEPHERLKRNIKQIINDRSVDIKRILSDPMLRKIVDDATKAALRNDVGDKTGNIGIWSHKLGWGTGPLNTDGDGKLIFDPSKACKNHGGYNYDKVCGIFDVLVGYGMTSHWGDARMEMKRYRPKRKQ